MADRPRLSSPDHSEGELEDEEEEEQEVEDEVDEVENEEGREEHIYHSLDRRENCSATEPVYAQPLKLKVSFYRKIFSLMGSSSLSRWFQSQLQKKQLKNHK